jgi:ribosomal protein L11 methyltransferase
VNSPLTPATHRVSFAIGDEHAAKGVVDVLTEIFFEGEAAVAAFERPDGRWDVTVHFAEAPDQALIRELVGNAAGNETAKGIVFDTIEARDWVKASLEDLVPVPAGRFVVHGAHDRKRVPANKLGIEIEAALAFGTGHHGTTRGCLLLLDHVLKARRPASVLDLGTGTGVLAIAAARALRRPVLASDIDARAVTIARGNARNNGAAAYIDTIRAAGLDARVFRERAPFRLIFANILLEPLKALATPMSRLVARNGHVVLSGLLAGQASAALASYRARGLVLARRVPLEGWITLVLVRQVRGSRGLPCGGSIAGRPSAP